LLGVFACVQAASSAFSADAAVPYAVARHVPLRFATAVYGTLVRIAPAPYVTSSLAAYELGRGDFARAHAYAISMPASPVRDDLLARSAAAGGNGPLAFEYYLAAPDVDAVESYVESAATHDPAKAYELEEILSRRLALSGTHPDGVAETRWRMGLLANRRAWREVPDSPAQGAWLERAMDAFASALALAPLSDRYAIAAANQAMLLGQIERSKTLFAQAERSNPGSADAIAGLGVVAYQEGDVHAATDALLRAERIDPNALMVRALSHDLTQ
jgi:tetratricopeptide (TPR) repeat protein